MRTDLRLNYNELGNIRDRIFKYHTALSEIEEALKNLKSFLAEQESEAIDKLKERMENVNIDIGKKKDTLEDLGKILGNYITDMKSFVDQVGAGQTRVDTWDISANILQIQAPISDLNLAISIPTRTGFHLSLSFDEEDERRSEKLERNYKRLENYRTGYLKRLVGRLSERVRDMRDIYDKYLKPYENLDDSYRSQLNGLYQRHTSEADKKENFWESFASIASSFAEALVIAAIFAFTIALLPTWAIVAIVVVTTAGCAVMANVPEESVPDWLKGVKNAADRTAEDAVEILNDPMVLVEKIGQGLADTIQTPEGIATLAGTTVGTIAGGYAGSKVKAIRADSNILIDKYKNLRKNPKVTGQAHHLNQNAAFKDVIPRNEGLAIELKGNIFKDIGSQHYKAHSSLEGFWNQYRSKGLLQGKVPTVSEYNSALFESLRAAGFTKKQTQEIVQSAINQQVQYGLTGNMFVPRIPGRINLPK